MSNETFDPSLNVETAKFPENHKGGFMICGINWGGDPDKNYNQPAPDTKPASFFTDIDNKYPYKDRIVSWLQLLGHPIKRTKKEVLGSSQLGAKGDQGEFERSFLQTNWFTKQSPDAREFKFPSDYLDAWDDFERRLKELNPKYIMFIGRYMFETLCLNSCKTRAEKLFGNVEKEIIWGSEGEVLPETEGFDNKHRTGLLKFANLTVIGLPHPSSRVKNEYIKAYRKVLGPVIEDYKRSLRKLP